MSNVALDRTQVDEINPTRPPSAPGAYKLVRWKPVYDSIVSEHILGKSNKYIAEKFDYTEVSISNILRSEEARKMIYEATKHIRQATNDAAAKQADLQVEINTKILERTKEFIEKNELASNSPFAFMEMLMKINNPVKPISAQQPNSPTLIQVNNNNINATVKPEQLERMNKALEISNG